VGDPRRLDSLESVLTLQALVYAWWSDAVQKRWPPIIFGGVSDLDCDLSGELRTIVPVMLGVGRDFVHCFGLDIHR